MPDGIMGVNSLRIYPWKRVQPTPACFWTLLSGLGGEIQSEEDISSLRSRTTTPGAFFLDVCDGKFRDEDLNDKGNAFTQAYFDFEKGKYPVDYEAAIGGGLPELYHVKNTWENFDKLHPVLQDRFLEWEKDQAN